MNCVSPAVGRTSPVSGFQRNIVMGNFVSLLSSRACLALQSIRQREVQPNRRCPPQSRLSDAVDSIQRYR